MKRGGSVQRSLFSLRNFLLYFCGCAFVVTCSILLFTGSTLDEAHSLEQRAWATFFNVIFLSLLLSVLAEAWQRFSIGRPVRRILDATRRVTQGDFSARVEPCHSFERRDELDVVIENFNIMAQELSSVETLRGDFIASVSHELKTPLAVIQNYAAILKTPGLPEEERMRCAGAIGDATRRLSELVTNILRLNKLENQQIFLQPRRYLLNEQLCECILGFEALWEQKDLEIDTELDEDVPVEADAELLALVWNNLLSNAVKFTPEGGRISVRLARRDDWVEVQVQDTGCGIPPEVGRRIFEKFYQGDTSHATQGNGLGLALVKRIIQITGGEISVASTPGQSSTFTVRLPQSAPPQTADETGREP